MTVVTVDSRVLGGPTAPAALGALVDELGDAPTLVCFDGPWPRGVEVETVATLRRLPALSIAVDCPDPTLADACDLAAPELGAVESLRVRFQPAPHAAVTAALLATTAPHDTR